MIARPKAHQHAGCKALKHWCRCASPDRGSCQTCARNRFNTKAAELYRDSLSVVELLERQA
jgi:hypothetical protein